MTRIHKHPDSNGNSFLMEGCPYDFRYVTQARILSLFSDYDQEMFERTLHCMPPWNISGYYTRDWMVRRGSVEVEVIDFLRGDGERIMSEVDEETLNLVRKWSERLLM